MSSDEERKETRRRLFSDDAGSERQDALIGEIVRIIVGGDATPVARVYALVKDEHAKMKKEREDRFSAFFDGPKPEKKNEPKDDAEPEARS